MISNFVGALHTPCKPKFQSPMGISMISNYTVELGSNGTTVSIPNGDKHDFKPDGGIWQQVWGVVSIPNGDKHDFKPSCTVTRSGDKTVSIPNGDKHDFKRPPAPAWPPAMRFNPQWG